MRVLFTAQDTGALYGTEEVTLRLLERLQESGDVAVQLALIRESRLDYGRSDAFRAKAAARDIPLVLLETHAPFSPALTRRIGALARTWGADVLHSTGYKADVHGWLAAPRCPRVSTVHGWLFRPELKERFYGWLNRQALKRFARVVALSSFYRGHLLKQGFNPARVVHIPSGMETVDEFPQRADREEPFTFGVLGRLSWEKNHRMLLEAFAMLPGEERRPRLLIAGDGPCRDELAAAIGRLGLAGCVELAGYLPREEFFRRIGALILCSRMENLPRSIQEAMRSGIPVVASNTGGIPDLIEQEKTGLLVPADDPRAWADAMQRVAGQPAARRAWATAAHDKLKREFSEDLWIGRHIEIYRSLRECKP